MLWPLDCPDDILENTIRELKMLENDQKLALDKDGQKVRCVISLDCITLEEVLGHKLRAVLARVFGQQLWVSRDAREEPVHVLLLQEDRFPLLQGPMMVVFLYLNQFA